jgi:hypothetical protein
MQIFRHFYNLELQEYQVNQSKNKKASTFADAFSYYVKIRLSQE